MHSSAKCSGQAHSPTVADWQANITNYNRWHMSSLTVERLSITQYHVAYFKMSAFHTTQWLPVLANIPLLNLRQKSAVDKMLSKIESHQNSPVHYVFNHPSPRLSSRRPIWSDLSPVDMNTQRKEEYQPCHSGGSHHPSARL